MNKDIGKLSALGNRERTNKTTPEQRIIIARIAAKARWLKRDQQPCAQCHAYRMAHRPPFINHKFVEEV